jgi:PAS domain-containing protein
VAHLGVWSWDVLDNTLIWNAEMYYMYEQPPELARSGLKYLHWRERVHPEDVLEAESHLQRAIDEEDDYDTVFRIIWRNGEIRYIKASAYIERDSHGRAIRVIGVNLDITASKTYEADILAAKQAAEAANNTRASSWPI